MIHGRLRWFRHVRRRGEEYMGPKVVQTGVQGRRKCSPQKKKWKELVKENLRLKDLAVDAAQVRVKWKRLVRNRV